MGRRERPGNGIEVTLTRRNATYTFSFIHTHETMNTPFLWDNFFSRTKQESLTELLRRVPIFESLTKRELRHIEHILHRRTYEEGEFVFREGDTGLGMYIIESGEVSIVSGSAENEVTRLSNGEFFGEMALLTEQPRSAGAMAMKGTKVFGFFQPDLFSLMETHPHIGVSVVMKLARILVERLYRAALENNKLRERIQNEPSV